MSQSAPDLDVIKDIPGYKVILKAILKSQIQQLVEQLASHTDEESVILTASVSDGTLCHLGSDSGKGFLEDHDDIKSQFLGFCLKRFHRKKEQEKEQKERERQERDRQEALRNMPPSPARYGGPRHGFMATRHPRFGSPRQLHPVALTRASPPGGGPLRSPSNMRPSPYPMTRPMRRPPPLNFNPNNPPPGNGEGSMRLPVGGKHDGQVIKIEADDSNEGSNSGSIDTNSQDAITPVTGEPNVTPSANSSQPSSPSQSPALKTKPDPSEPTEKEDDANSESSSSTIPNEASELKFSDTGPPEGLSLDSDLSNLIDQQGTSSNDGTPHTPNVSDSSPTVGAGGEEMDPNVNVKVEAITESEMELEITGVELGHGAVPGGSQDDTSWSGSQGATGYDPMAMMGSQQGSEQGYSSFLPGICDDFSADQITAMSMAKPSGSSSQRRRSGKSYACDLCFKCFSNASHLNRHRLLHTGAKPYACSECQFRSARRDSLKIHMATLHGKCIEQQPADG